MKQSSSLTKSILIALIVALIVLTAVFAYVTNANFIPRSDVPALVSTTNVATLGGSTSGQTLNNNTTYKVTSSITCSNSNAGGNGLTVAGSSTVVITVSSS